MGRPPIRCAPNRGTALGRVAAPRPPPPPPPPRGRGGAGAAPPPPPRAPPRVQAVDLPRPGGEVDLSHLFESPEHEPLNLRVHPVVHHRVTPRRHRHPTPSVIPHEHDKRCQVSQAGHLALVILAA